MTNQDLANSLLSAYRRNGSNPSFSADQSTPAVICGIFVFRHRARLAWARMDENKNTSWASANEVVIWSACVSPWGSPPKKWGGNPLNLCGNPAPSLCPPRQRGFLLAANRTRLALMRSDYSKYQIHNQVIVGSVFSRALNSEQMRLLQSGSGTPVPVSADNSESFNNGDKLITPIIP